MLKLQVYHNSHDSFFRKPFGAVPCGTTIRLRVEIRSEIPVTLCQLRLWEKGAVERLLAMDLLQSEKEEGSHRQVFTVDYRVPKEPGLVWYYFRLLCGEQVFYYGNNPENLGGEGRLAEAEPPGYQITVFRPFAVPSWFKQGVIYQIFVDRFYCNQEAFPPRGTGLSPGGLLHLDWFDTPFYLREEGGRIKRWTFFGGNLAGIRDKLDYLQGLGVSILYLNPIFRARSSHKYDTGDYFTIDPLYGDENIFRELVVQAQKKGISIILDGVFSHTGADSIYFNKEGNYPGLGAFQSPGSSYYRWYIFEEYPHRYQSWWGVDDLPNVNEMEASYREFICQGENSVVRHWLKAGARGWRLDVADELPDEFIKELRQAAKETDEEAVLIGEVWEDASNKVSYGKLRQYLWGEELDSVTNYPLRSIWLDFLLGKAEASLTHRRIMSLLENYPREHFYAAMNLIGSHDRIRVLTLLGEAPREETLTEKEKEKYRLGPEARKLAKKRLRLLSLVQMTFPGVPCIYYGDEAGLEGYSDPHNRGTYPWGREDQEILAWYRRMIRLRWEYPVLCQGDFRSFHQGEDIYGFQRKNARERLVVFVNRSLKENRKLTVEPELLEAARWEQTVTLDLLQGAVLGKEWDGSLEIPSLGARVIYLKQKEFYQSRKLPRAGGVLLAITSLPSAWGLGDLGRQAYEFVDFLAAAGQKVWQILPLNPPDQARSPYRSPGTFAGYEQLIDPEQLVQAGLLEASRLEEEQDRIHQWAHHRETYLALAAAGKERLYREAFRHFQSQPGSIDRKDYLQFQRENSFWLDDYCLYRALKKEFGGKPWYSWDKKIALREKEAVAYYRRKLAGEVAYQLFLQYIFFLQWRKLKEYANSRGLLIVGDLPMYAAPDSSDTWAHRRLFCLDEKGKPLKLAGVPPDYFSAKGQLWGNPLYAWDEMKKENYRWWVERVRRALQMADYLRLDHFRAFEAYWEVPREAKTAVQGYWKKGPGQHFFEVLFQELGELPLIAEDLGFLTPEVKNLKNIFGFPGMKVFQFSPREMLEEGEPGELYYTGTHDNDTLLGWCRKNWKKVIRLLADESGLLQTDSTSRVETEKPAGRHGKADPLVLSCRRIIEKLYLSKAPWVIVPLQDILGLGSEARMNKPGTTRGNWQWQFDRELLDEEKISWLRELAQKSGRI